MKAKRLALTSFMAVILLGFTSCFSFKVGGFTVDGDQLARIGKAAFKSMEDFTPEQEHYIGRSVAAKLLNGYKPYNREDLNRYVNTLGQVLASCSDRPNTYSGYHFMVLDSEELNAFAMPGGLIFITKKLISICETEDELAAVLAHEIAHVQLKHGLKAIESSRWAGVGSLLVQEAAKSYSKKDLSKLVTSFDGMIDDVTQKLVNSGYSRSSEYEADKVAIIILKRCGYNPNALNKMLGHLKRHHKDGGVGFTKTHPHPKNRMEEVEDVLKNVRNTSIPAKRTRRFNHHLKAASLR